MMKESLINETTLEILRLGAIGLSLLLAVMAFFLLRGEQAKPEPRENMLIATYVFMGFTLVLLAGGLLGEF